MLGAALSVGIFVYYRRQVADAPVFHRRAPQRGQVITVSAYGLVAAYLTEHFPTEVRSTGHGMGYSLSLVLPALYPFYLP